MSYSDLLNDYIEQSGLTISDIAKKAKARGADIDRTMISMLKNNKSNPPASEVFHRALAEATGGDAERLIFSAFTEQAPAMIRERLQQNSEPQALSFNGEAPALYDPTESFSMIVPDNNMTGDRIWQGDYIIVVRQEEVSPSHIAVISVNGSHPTIARIRREGQQYLLMPSNPAVPPTLHPIDSISIIGRIIEVRFKIE